MFSKTLSKRTLITCATYILFVVTHMVDNGFLQSTHEFIKYTLYASHVFLTVFLFFTLIVFTRISTDILKVLRSKKYFSVERVAGANKFVSDMLNARKAFEKHAFKSIISTLLFLITFIKFDYKALVVASSTLLIFELLLTFVFYYHTNKFEKIS